MITNELTLAIFFIYFVLMSGQCSEIMNCGLQRYISKHIWIKHAMLFLSIYLFTFVLKWYNTSAIMVEGFGLSQRTRDQEETIDSRYGNHTNKNQKKNNNSKKEKEKEKSKTSYLVESLYYSIFIYVIFIISTKNEGAFLALFLLSSLIIVFVQIFSKTRNSIVFEQVNKHYFVTENAKKEIMKKGHVYEDVDSIITTHNIVQIIYCVLFVFLLGGSYRYYLRQWGDHKKHWDWSVFWFGSNKCSHLR